MKNEQKENELMKQIRDNWIYLGAGAAFIAGIGISSAIIGVSVYTKEESQINNSPQEETENKEEDTLKVIVEKDAATVNQDLLEAILVAGCSNPKTDDWDTRVAVYKNCIAQYQDEAKVAAKYKQERDEAVAANQRYAEIIGQYEATGNKLQEAKKEVDKVKEEKKNITEYALFSTMVAARYAMSNAIKYEEGWRTFCGVMNIFHNLGGDERYTISHWSYKGSSKWNVNGSDNDFGAKELLQIKAKKCGE